MNNTINWFGEEHKNKTKHKSNSKSKHHSKKKNNSNPNPRAISFLGLKNVQPVNFLGVPSIKSKKILKNNIPRVNFLGLSTKKHNMTPSPFMMNKHSNKKRKLPKWGDADFDGTPNWLDCDPLNPFKDYEETKDGNRPKIEKQKVVPSAQELINQAGGGSKIKKQFSMKRETVAKEKAPVYKKIEYKTTPAQAFQYITSGPKVKRQGFFDEEIHPERYASREPAKSKFLPPEQAQQVLIETQAKMQGVETAEAKQKKEKRNAIMKPFQYVKKGLDVYAGRKLANTKTDTQVNQWESELKSSRDLLSTKKPGSSEYKQLEADITKREESLGEYKGKVKEAEEAGAEKLAVMKIPRLAGKLATIKYEIKERTDKGLAPTKKQLIALQKVEEKASLKAKAKAVLEKVPGTSAISVMTGSGIERSGEYSNALKAKAARVRTMTKFAAGQIFGPNLTSGAFASSEPRGRGRPAGPSGEYRIGGKPVYEADFQQYSSKQAALNRMLPSEQQSASLNPEYVALLKAQEAAQRGETKTVMTEDGMPMEGEVTGTDIEGLPKMGTSMMQTGQQQIDLQQKRAYSRATPDEIKMAQYRAQAMDNPLTAPNFMKGELKATGGNILTPIGPGILDAPQVFKGEMRNVTKSNPDEGEVKLGQRPQTNPYGDEYLEIEAGSGKPVIRKRIREKWMTGEAL